MAVLVRRHNSGRNPQRMQPVQRYQPFRELEEIQQQTAQLLEQMMGAPPEVVRPWIPDVDIEETDDAWIVEAELPGAKQEDVNVEVRENELVVTGEIKQKEREGILRRRTRRVGQFEYRVTLPGEVDAERIDASLDHGVLTLRVPKPERTQPRRVEVGSSSNGQN